MYFSQLYNASSVWFGSLFLFSKKTFWNWFGLAIPLYIIYMTWNVMYQEILFDRPQTYHFSWHLLRLPTARSSRLDTALRRSILHKTNKSTFLVSHRNFSEKRNKSTFFNLAQKFFRKETNQRFLVSHRNPSEKK